MKRHPNFFEKKECAVSNLLICRGLFIFVLLDSTVCRLAHT